MEQIAERSKQQAERPRHPGKQAGPSGRTVSMTAANAGLKPPDASPRRAISLTAGNSEEPPQPSDRDTSGSFPPMIAEEGDSEGGAGLGPSSTTSAHKAGVSNSAGSGIGIPRGSNDPADVTDVATLRRLLSEKEVELQSERVRVKQYEVSAFFSDAFGSAQRHLAPVTFHPAHTVQ